MVHGRRRAVAWLAAVLALLVLAGVVTLVGAQLRGPQAQFERWLAQQPGVGAVDRVNWPHQPPGSQSPSVRLPTAEVTMRQPLLRPTVARFMTEFQAYAAGHGEARSWTVQLAHGPDRVLAEALPEENIRLVTVLTAMRELPGAYAVDIGLSPWPAHQTAVLATGTDLVRAAADLSRAVSALPDHSSALWRGTGLTVRAAGLPHTVTVHGKATPTPRAARAFAVATDLERRHPVALVLVQAGSGPADVELRLSADSPTAVTTRSAVNATGFGMASHHESVQGGTSPDRGSAGFDTAAWAARSLPAVRAVPGVLEARVSAAGDTKGSVLDVRVAGAAVLAHLAGAVPDAVDEVRVHTARAAPDHERKAVLPEDEETTCPAGRGTTNTAYTGPPELLRAAAAYLAAVQHVGDVSCLHWWVPGPQDTAQGQRLDVRVPLQEDSWRPVLDTVLAHRRDLASAHPTVYLLLPSAGHPWTALLGLPADGTEPSPATAVAGSVTEIRAAGAALEPLLRYWRSGLKASS
jgi:hypothetical protein